MSALTLSARLDRSDPNTPWGFRMAGGKDYGQPLTIQRVTPGSLASKCGLQVGDAITKIGGMPTDSLKHKDAQSCIIQGGNSVELAQTRGGSFSRPPVAVEPAYEPSQPSYSAPPSSWNPENFPPSTPQAQNQNYNTAPKPFSPAAGTMPVAVNKQYNTPINMYSVGNVMDSLATQTAGMNVGGGPEPTPPWRGNQAPAGPPHGGMGAPSRPSPAAAAPRPSPAAAPAARPSPAAAPASRPAAPSGGGGGGAWQPKIPTGPRNMKVGRAGEVKTFTTPQAGKIPVCSSCGITIRGPFILALDRTWCPDHFNCSNPNCRRPLVDCGFVEEEGQLFCEADYRQFFAPRCSKCGEAIIGEIVNALNATYHMDCFLCSHCKTAIGKGSFHTEDGKIYCQKDWQAMFQTKCHGCDFPIEPGDRWVEALGGNWHSECFNCSSCQMSLEGQSFFAKGGKPYCKKHAMGKKF